MAGLNTTGAASPEDYLLGRGRLLFANIDATTGKPDSDGFRFIGNVPEFTVSMTAETASHQASYTQLKFTDARCTLSQEVGVSFSSDELSFQNMSDFFSGGTSVVNNPHGVAMAAEVEVTDSLVKGRYYELYSDTGERLYHVKDAGAVYNVQYDVAGTDTLLVEGTDYEIESQLGLIRILPTSTTASAGNDFSFQMTVAATTTVNLDAVTALSRSDVKVACIFESLDACNSGKKMAFNFRRLSLTAEGDFALIGEDYTAMSFTGVAEINTNYTAAQGQTLQILDLSTS